MKFLKFVITLGYLNLVNGQNGLFYGYPSTPYRNLNQNINNFQPEQPFYPNNYNLYQGGPSQPNWNHNHNPVGWNQPAYTNDRYQQRTMQPVYTSGTYDPPSWTYPVPKQNQNIVPTPAPTQNNYLPTPAHEQNRNRISKQSKIS
jgi:hypothetical protein